MEKIFDFIKAGLNYVDNGNLFRQPFKWLYYILGAANVLIPVGIIINLVKYSEWLPGQVIACMVFLLLLSIPIAFVGAMIWINRGNNLEKEVAGGSRFVAIPIVANLIQTFGEWLGFMIGVGGFVGVLLILLFNSEELSYVLPVSGFAYMLIVYPIAGFLTVVFGRFLAEACLVFASIANHSQSIDKEVKKIAEK